MLQASKFKSQTDGENYIYVNLEDVQLADLR